MLPSGVRLQRPEPVVSSPVSGFGPPAKRPSFDPPPKATKTTDLCLRTAFGWPGLLLPGLPAALGALPAAILFIQPRFSPVRGCFFLPIRLTNSPERCLVQFAGAELGIGAAGIGVSRPLSRRKTRVHFAASSRLWVTRIDVSLWFACNCSTSSKTRSAVD
jgi:hypothetical protein